MRAFFVESVVDALLSEGAIAPSDSVLAVCAGRPERDAFHAQGFANVLISNLDERMRGDEFAPYRWSRQDAQNLSFGDGDFHWGFVADGLHHCASPHRAVLELYRVARKGIVVVETRDNVLMRLATRLGLSPEYEVEAVAGNDFRYGGVDNSEIPNFIYRWRENDFMKTIRSFDPTGRHRFRFFHGMDLPHFRAATWRNPVKRLVVTNANPLVRAFTSVFPKQGNLLAMVAMKPQVPDDLWPWLRADEGRVVFNRDYAEPTSARSGDADPAKQGSEVAAPMRLRGISIQPPP